MSVQELIRSERSQPRGADRPPVGSGGVRLRPLIAAAVVLLLWGAWLLVPDPARRDLLGAPGPLPTWTSPVTTGPDEPAAEPVEQPPVQPVAQPPAEPVVPPVAELVVPPVAEPVEQLVAEPTDQPVEVPQRGGGTFAVATGSTAVVGDGQLVRYRVEVETGVPLDPDVVAGTVDAVLADPRSWTGQGEWALQRTDGAADVRIVVASPDTTDAMCLPLRTNGEVSCRNGDDVVLNALRWTQGARSWGDDVTGYRQYLVNHELGHYLGRGHVTCRDAGQPAPVMLQQTLGLQGCAPNAWPFPG